MKHPIQRRLMYLLFQGLRGLAQLLPFSVARRLGKGVGAAAYLLLSGQRRLALDHLQYAFGDWLTPVQRRHTARRAFMNLGQNVLEWLALSGVSQQQIQRLITSEGVEHLRAALAKGDGAILISPHFGNWELVPIYLRSLGFEGVVLARRLRYAEYESFLINLRGRRGIPTLARGALKEVVRVLRANQMVGMLPDQDMDSLEGIFVNFFGHPAYTPIGPAALSVMSRAPIVPCFLIREQQRFRLVIEPPLSAPSGGERDQAIAALTQRWSDVMESYIRRYPDHWVWMHRRWKTQPSAGQARPQSGASVPDAARSTTPAPSRSEMFNTTTVSSASRPLGHLAIGLVLGGALLWSAMGCSKSSLGVGHPDVEATDPAAPAQEMSRFVLTGYQDDGSRRWELHGHGATIDENIVTIHHPDAIGYDIGRTAYLTASAAQVNQTDRHVRLEHEVTVHTTEGVWLTAPILHWIPDQNRVATDAPVRIETDHVLLRGRGANGLTQLKQLTLLQDIEMVLNPTDHELSDESPRHVTITCDGPLSFDYLHNVAIFEQNVHVIDPNGELFSDRLVAYLNQQSRTIRYAEATGHVRIQQQQNTAVSQRAVYEPAIGKITLVGKPLLTIFPDTDHPQPSLGALSTVESRAENLEGAPDAANRLASPTPPVLPPDPAVSPGLPAAPPPETAHGQPGQ